MLHNLKKLYLAKLGKLDAPKSTIFTYNKIYGSLLEKNHIIKHKKTAATFEDYYSMVTHGGSKVYSEQLKANEVGDLYVKDKVPLGLILKTNKRYISTKKLRIIEETLNKTQSFSKRVEAILNGKNFEKL